MIDRLKLESILPAPVVARHVEYTMIFSADDDFSKPSQFLIEVALNSARLASKISLEAVSTRLRQPPYYPDIWPGEHYRLLAGIVEHLNAKNIVEVGTATGLSALSFKHSLPENGIIHTFDIIPWDRVPQSCLNSEDFSDGRLVHCTADLRDLNIVKNYLEILKKSEIIFIDAAKDGFGEYAIINNLRQITFDKPPLVIFDDIRLWNMLKIWRELTAPKLDITSFGHWSGTGLVDWRW